MKDSIKPELMKLLGITDDKIANDVIAYAKSLTNFSRNANDLALAKALNERTTNIVDMVAGEIKDGIHDSVIDTSQVNKSYILLVNELKKLYVRNEELEGLIEIGKRPIWQYIDIIEGLLLICMTKSIRNLGKNRSRSGINYQTLKRQTKPTTKPLLLCYS